MVIPSLSSILMLSSVGQGGLAWNWLGIRRETFTFCWKEPSSAGKAVMETGAVMPIPTPETDTQTLLKKSRFSGTHKINREFTEANFSFGKLLIWAPCQEWASLGKRKSHHQASAWAKFSLHTRTLGNKCPKWPLEGILLMVLLLWFSETLCSSDESAVRQQGL